MLYFLFPSVLLLSGILCAADDYHWPSPQYDQLEALLYEGRRGDGSSLSSIVHPCRFRIDTNASIAAEWLRFSFHDMATYDASNGSGGLDGSIAYELGREENFGAGFTSTLSDFEVYPNRYISRADIIALGTVFAVSTCGGPVISYRGGRVDAWTAGPAGVPEPQQDLPTLEAMFSRAGFSVPEMIQLTACGHTLGGVRSTDFPTLVTPNPNSQTPRFINFDTTTQFDNAIVTQYLDGTSQDPLVVNSNQTMTSDLRVFSADANATMQGLASPGSFSSTCQTILERMINTVPNGVVLTNEITLLPAKVHDVELTFEKGQFVFKASFRLLQAVNATVNEKRTVKMSWCDRYGGSQNCNGKTLSSGPASTVNEKPGLSPVSVSMGYTFINYNFVVPVQAPASISTFWFEVDENDGSSATSYKNGGNGYAVAQDQILFVPTLSSMVLVQNSTVTKRGGSPVAGLVKQYTIVAAVRDGSDFSRVYIDALDVATPGFSSPLNTSVDLSLNSSITSTQGYSFYTGTVIDNGFQLTLDMHAATGNGTIYTQDFRQTSFLDNTPYVAPTNVTSSGKTSVSSSLRLSDNVLLTRFPACAILVAVVLRTLL